MVGVLGGKVTSLSRTGVIFPVRLWERIRKVTKRASVFKATIASLPDRHWAAIVEGAKEYLGRNTVVEGRQKDPMVVEESDDDEDEVLIDPMFAD